MALLRGLQGGLEDGVLVAQRLLLHAVYSPKVSSPFSINLNCDILGMTKLERGLGRAG